MLIITFGEKKIYLYIIVKGIRSTKYNGMNNVHDLIKNKKKKIFYWRKI